MSSTSQFKKRAWFGQADWVQLSPMKLPETFSRMARVPQLTRTRMVLAFAAAVIADGLQFLLGPFGWVIGDQIIDAAAMVLTSWLIGFHWLLLPTFALEFIPLADELPTWTACVAAVIVLRRREQRTPPPLPPAPPEKPVIEI
jgi:hypothetical protein